MRDPDALTAPTSPDRRRARTVLASDAALVRAHGIDAEASLVRALSTATAGTRDVRDHLSAARADALAVAREDLDTIRHSSGVSEAVRLAATERIAQIDELIALLSLAVNAAHLTRTPAPAGDGDVVCHVRARDDGAHDLAVYQRADVEPFTKHQAAQHLLHQPPNPLTPTGLIVLTAASLAVLALLVLAIISGNTDPTAWVLVALLALVDVAELALASQRPRWRRGIVTGAETERAALDAATHPERLTPVAIYDGRELGVLHAFTPKHALWTTSLPGLEPADPDAPLLPVHANLARAATSADPQRAARASGWLTVACPLLDTYLDDPDHDVSAATSDEVAVMDHLASLLLDSIRDLDAEAAVARAAAERVETTRLARTRRRDMLEALRPETELRENT